MKKIISYVMTFVLAVCCFSLSVSATEASEPVLNGKVLYANGTAITVAARTDEEAGAKITWGTTGTMNVPADTVIFGGGLPGTTYATTSVTMTGGKILSIFGGGFGGNPESANVGTANITVSGGTISKEIDGGGYLTSTVDKVNITVTGGTIGGVKGGGYSIKQDYLPTTAESVGTKEHPENSPCIVKEVVINISGGTFKYESAAYGTVYGGGLGYSYTKKTTINVSGTADLSKAWLVGGGSNGRTDDAIVNVSGGTVNVLQTINRGSMINATVNVSGGTITTLYAGGEDPEAFDNDIVNGGFLGNIIVDITGGTVTSLLPGSNYDERIAVNADYVSVMYDAESVGNESTFAEAFGESAKAYVDEGIVLDESDTPITIPEQTLYGIKEQEKTYVYFNEEEGYSWTFEGTDITDPTIEVDTEITLTEEAPETVKEDIEKLIPADTEVLFINFSHDGELPGKAKVTIRVDDAIEDGTKLFIAHYNETTKKLEWVDEVTVKDGTISFEITECSVYTATSIALVKNPKTFDGTTIYFVIAMLALLFVGTSVYKIKKYN